MGMERQILQVGTFEVNCVLLAQHGRAWIVDPGADVGRIVALLEKSALTPELILLTHAHFDHVGGVPDLQRHFPGLPVYIHPLDAQILAHPLNAFPPDYPPISEPSNIRDCRDLEGVTVIETPGHTPGGCCYFFPEDKLLLSGDTLFAGSVGRTDFPGGDMPTLMKSLEKLAALPDETLVIPGHGPQTTIGREKRGNPYFAR